MDELVALALPYREGFLLVFVRLAAMLTTAPLLSHRSVPVTHRAGLALLLALVLVPVIGRTTPVSDNLAALVVALFGEALIGGAIGFVAGLAIASVQSAGEVLGFQMGLGLGAVYDPAMGQQATVITRLFDVLGLMLFLALDGHHIMVSAVAASFHRLRPGAAMASAGLASGVVVLGGKVLRSALEVAAPLVGVLFVVNVVLALLARVAPHLNIFAVGIPLAVAVGLFGLVETLPHALAVSGRLLGELGGDVHRLITGGVHGLR
jgi:flagellar biosynthetic protein FliR